MRCLAWMVTLGLAVVTSLQAQQTPPPDPGARVRVSVGAPYEGVEPVIGTLVELTPDYIVILQQGRREGEIQLPRTAITRFEVSRGSPSSRSSIVGIGMFGGAVAGGVLGYLLNVEGDDLPPEIPAALGAFVGGGIGALIGLGAASERWQSVPLLGQATGAHVRGPTNRFGLSLQIRFWRSMRAFRPAAR